MIINRFWYTDKGIYWNVKLPEDIFGCTYWVTVIYSVSLLRGNKISWRYFNHRNRLSFRKTTIDIKILI